VKYSTRIQISLLPCTIHTTLFVVGDDAKGIAMTITLVETIPDFKALKARPLENSKIVELSESQLAW
jgi:predicted dinucleotide-binding enzyme